MCRPLSHSPGALPSALVAGAAAWMNDPIEAAPAIGPGAATTRRVDDAQRAQISAWMRSLAHGDRSAFAPLLEALWPVVHRVALRMLPNRADADDAAQDALIRLASRVTEFDPARDAVAWVIGITIWECRTHRKRLARRREEGLDAVSEGTAAERDPEASAIARDLESTLAEVIERLGPGDAEVIRAALREERDVEGAGGATFRKRLQRSIGRLRSAWRATHGDE